MAFVIDGLVACVSVDKAGEEGLMAFFNPNSGWIPLIAADETRLAQMIPMAESIKRQTGQEYRIIHFHGRTDVTGEMKVKYGSGT